MKEMTDRELTDKISQVFENFEAPDAAHGWQELRKKYPENNTRSLIFWWSAAAAVLVLVCGLWFVIPDKTESPKKVANAKQKENLTNDKQTENIVKNGAEQGSHASSPDDSTGYASETESSKPADDESIITSASSAVDRIISASEGQVKPERMDILSAVPVQNPAIENSNTEISPIVLPEKIKPLHATNNWGTNRDSIIDATAKMLALAPVRSETDNHIHSVENVPFSSKKISSKKNTFSFYAGSYFNYSLGSETELNFGAGFTSDIKLTNNLKLSTGLALANNSLRYNNGVPSTSKEKLLYDALPSFSQGINSGNNNLTTVTSYDARLLALDIPINLKYLIIPEDNKLYLLAGLSSGTYLNETYSVGYRNYSSAGSYVSQTQAVKVKKQLQAFDLIRTLNISFGYSSGIGKSQSITIEPFLKYPLGGLGSEDLRFGSTGINLKMNFSHFKKR